MQTDWKIAAAAIIGLSIVASALIFSGNDVISGFFSLPTPSSKTTQIELSLSEDKYSFDVSDAPLVEVLVGAPLENIALQVGKERFDLSNLETASLKAEGFTGRIEFDGKKIILKGSAKKAFVNSLGFKDKVSIILEADHFSKLVAEKIRLNIFSNSITGTLSADSGKTSVKLDKDSLNIGGFEGNLMSEGSGINLDGTAQRVSVAGKVNIG